MSPSKTQPLQNPVSNSSKAQLETPERILLMLVSLGIVVVMAVALWLTPDPKGFGTHHQLGLPECSFRTMTGLKCPHCGMTTSFCWLVRGELARSWHVSPAGFLLAVACLGLAPWLAAVSIKGRWLVVEAPAALMIYGAAGWLLLSLILWLLRLA